MHVSKLRVLLPVLALVSLAAPSTSGSHVVKLPKAQEAKQMCVKKFTVQNYRSYASRVYKREKVSFKAHKKLRLMHVCQHSWRARKAVGNSHAAYKADRYFRNQVNSLTPYAGPNGTRWAIPWYIVNCESHGSWSAYNPSGASGPYQLLGWGAPMPANTPARKLAHHRIAARLWAGGRGASHWVCA